MSTPTTEVRLLSNVPLSNSYEHQRTFISKAAQSSYFTGKTAFYGAAFTYQREHSTIKYPIHYDALSEVNYLMYRNGAYPDKWFYAFITKKEYVNPNTTLIHFQLDVFQSWQFDYELKPSFIEREHQRRWDNDLKPIVNTVDEGLNYGTDYETVSVQKYLPYDDVYFLVIVASQRMDVNGEGITPMLNGLPQPLSYYLHPFKLDGALPKVKLGETEINMSPVTDVLTNLYKQEGAQNNIVSLYVTEYPGINLSYNGTDLVFPVDRFDHATIQDDTGTMNTLYLKKNLKYQERYKNLGGKFSGFKGVFESKLLMYPYTVTILSDMKGNQQEIKPEYIQGDDIEIYTKGSLGVSNKVSYNVKNYLVNESSIPLGSEISFSNGIINNAPNDVPIITELLSAYLQGNRNQLENQKDSIIFGSLANTVGNLFGGIGSAIAGNPVGAVSAGADMVVGATNAHFQIEGMQAKKRDLSSMPPQMSKMGSNTAFDYGNGIQGLYVIRKQITLENRTRLENYFKMFGYKVNDLKKPNLKSRENFNFIKTVGANVVGNIPHDDLIKIKQIFDTGVTLWHGDYVGDYSVNNVEV